MQTRVPTPKIATGGLRQDTRGVEDPAALGKSGTNYKCMGSPSPTWYDDDGSDDEGDRSSSPLSLLDEDGGEGNDCAYPSSRSSADDNGDSVVSGGEEAQQVPQPKVRLVIRIPGKLERPVAQPLSPKKP